MKKILAVIRVSTETQETESQKNELVNFILSLGKYQENEIEFIEVQGASAVKMNDKYLQMLQSIKDKITESDTIRSVAFWHLNRLGRNETLVKKNYKEQSTKESTMYNLQGTVMLLALIYVVLCKLYFVLNSMLVKIATNSVFWGI